MEQRKDCDTCAHEAKLGIENPCRDCWKGDQWEPKKPEPDNVNHPAHYESQTSLECIDVMEIAFGAEAVGNFCLCNAFKYLWRHKHKGGKEDLRKAKWYLDRFEVIESEYADTYENYVKMRALTDKALEELG
jgi:hypothetical protein